MIIIMVDLNVNSLTKNPQTTIGEIILFKKKQYQDQRSPKCRPDIV